MVFNSDEIVTAFKPDKRLDDYFKKYTKMNERSIIKWLKNIGSGEL